LVDGIRREVPFDWMLEVEGGVGSVPFDPGTVLVTPLIH
jgi:hypothetical protein